jgi:type IV pilus assembly protein PilP
MWVQIGVGMLAIMSCMVSSAGHAEETGERLVDISLSQAAPAPVSIHGITTTSANVPPSQPFQPTNSVSTPESAASPPVSMLPVLPGEYSYNASGRREPFAAIVKDGHLPGEDDQNLPPLQRISLTELNLIGIIWGGFGYSAMVQTPDGKGYTVRQGTRIGPNNGTVSSITENAVIVHERYTDVYGSKQVREYVKLLHAKEGSE